MARRTPYLGGGRRRPWGLGRAPTPRPGRRGGRGVEGRRVGDAGIRPAPMGNSVARLIEFFTGRVGGGLLRGAAERVAAACWRKGERPGGFVRGQMVPPLLDAVFSANGGRTSVGGAGGWVDGELACRREGGVRRRARGGPSKPLFFPTSTLLLFRGPWILRKPPGLQHSSACHPAGPE